MVQAKELLFGFKVHDENEAEYMRSHANHFLNDPKSTLQHTNLFDD